MPRQSGKDAVEGVADHIHSAAIHLLRFVREIDEASGLSPARLSALSVVVFAGELTLADLAGAEHVTSPTMSRLVAGLEADGLVRRDPHPHDGRAVRIRATARGRALLQRGRSRRVERLATRLGSLDPAQVRTLREAAELIEVIARDRGGSS
jgi:DNA-binding MarR family transcriptional regulator